VKFTIRHFVDRCILQCTTPIFVCLHPVNAFETKDCFYSTVIDSPPASCLDRSTTTRIVYDHRHRLGLAWVCSHNSVIVRSCCLLSVSSAYRSVRGFVPASTGSACVFFASHHSSPVATSVPCLRLRVICCASLCLCALTRESAFIIAIGLRASFHLTVCQQQPCVQLRATLHFDLDHHCVIVQQGAPRVINRVKTRDECC
jgi:hypothetical protein